MVEVKSWTILIGKDEVPYITWEDGFLGRIQASPESEMITVTNEGIEFEWTARRGNAQRYRCLFNALGYTMPPMPLDRQVGIGNIMHGKEHVLTFLYDFISRVLMEKSPLIARKEPVDVEKLLAKYSAFRRQLEGLDFKVMAGRITLKDRHCKL